MPDVSVCIVNWNCRDLLRQCLASLHRQPQGVTLETIVVDNASGDGAAAMVADEFPEVTLVRNPINAGFAAANNQAATRAGGRYLFFLNNDTVLPAGTLRRLVDYAAAHPEAGIIGPRLRDGEGRLQVSYRRRPTVMTFLHRTSFLRWTRLLRHTYRQYRREYLESDIPRPVDVLLGAAMFIPRAVFDACGGWDGHYTFGGEDLDLCYRVGRRHQVVYHPGVEITHFGRASTRRHIGFAATRIPVGFVRYLRKTGCPRAALVFYKVVVSLDAPLQFLGKAVQYGWRRARGRKAKAGKSLLALRGLGAFLLRGLVPFWRA